jgi:hypothetical protein
LECRRRSPDEISVACSGVLAWESSIGVPTTPGLSVFARMPLSLNLAAQVREYERSAALVAA